MNKGRDVYTIFVVLFMVGIYTNNKNLLCYQYKVEESSIQWKFDKLLLDEENEEDVKDVVSSPGTRAAVERGRIAIVYKVMTIKANEHCACERFLALTEGILSSADDDVLYDIILLRDPDHTFHPQLMQWIEDREDDRVQVHTSPTPSKYLSVQSTDRRNRKGKSAFLLWVLESILKRGAQVYENYWFVEDDVFWTGQWRTFFKKLDQQLDADFVSHHRRVPLKRWWVGKSCRVNGRVCWDEATKNISKTYNNLFRVSHRFVEHLLELLLRGSLKGHHEASFIAALEFAGGNYTHSQLFTGQAEDYVGYNQMGGWSVWRGDNKEDAVYSLQGLVALGKHGSNEWIPEKMKLVALHGLQTTSNLDAPTDKIYHPVKCAADLTVGGAALAFATRQKNENQVESLRSICRQDVS